MANFNTLRTICGPTNQHFLMFLKEQDNCCEQQVGEKIKPNYFAKYIAFTEQHAQCSNFTIIRTAVFTSYWKKKSIYSRKGQTESD